MAIEWVFPSNNYGTLSGIGEAGIETFKGAPYRSLAREICQNSLDARAGYTKPVRVEFSMSTINAGDIPRFAELKDALNRCLSFWQDQKNEKTVAFFKEATAVASAPSIDLMRISDFNTSGLTGSDKEYSTPWQDLVKASGVSSKGGTSGGSFGIGKSAPFACSKMRTVFYATRDIQGLEAFQGIARLVSFRMKPGFFGLNGDCVTTGIGYYGETKKNSAIRKCISLDKSFMRKEPGTDVYILGFMNNGNWKREMVRAVIEDFLIAVYEGALEVIVQDTLVSAETLPKIIEDYKDEAKAAYNYYMVLTSPSTEVIKQDFNGLGEIELRILIQNDLHRRVLINRKNGMKIFDQKNISASIQFAGICVLKDDGINRYFRQMENPQHDAWEPERHSNPSQAKKYKTELARLIKDTIIERGKKTTIDEVDAEGVGEFLPDQLPVSGNDANRFEAPNDNTKDIEITISKPKTWQKGFEHNLFGNGESEEISDSETGEVDFGGEGGKDQEGETGHADHDGTAFGGGNGNGPGTNGNGDNPVLIGPDGEKQPGAVVRKTVQVQLMAVRIFRTDAQTNSYRLIYNPKKDYKSGYLQLKLSGEQKSVDVAICSASAGGRALQCKGNRIMLSDIKANQRAAVDFSISYSDACAMEVSLYGYSV